MRNARIGLALVLIVLLAGCDPADSGRVGNAPATSPSWQNTVTAETGPGEPSPTPTAELEEPSAVPTEEDGATPTAPVATEAAETSIPQRTMTTATPPAAQGMPSGRGRIYLVQNGALVAIDPATGRELPREAGIKVSTGEFAISPDGRRAAVLNDEEGQIVLDIVDLDGRASYHVAEGQPAQLAWAPDSKALAFVTGAGGELCRPGSQVMVAEIPLTGTLISAGDGCDPAWSPEGKRLAYVSYSDILSRPDNELRLVNRQGQHGWAPASGILGGEEFPEPRRTFSTPWWSSDGKQIFMLARFSEFAETSWSTIEMVDATAGTALPVGIARDVDGRSLRLSPDRTRIAYLSSGAKGTNFLVLHTPLAEEYRWNPPWYEFEGRDRSVALRDKVGVELEHVYAAAWSPDGRQLAIVFCQELQNPVGLCDQSSKAELRLLDAQTGALSEPLLTDVDIDGHVEWAP